MRARCVVYELRSAMVANSVDESEMLDEKDNLYFDLLFESNLYI